MLIYQQKFPSAVMKAVLWCDQLRKLYNTRRHREDGHRSYACDAQGRVQGMTTAVVEKAELNKKETRGWPLFQRSS